MTYYSVIMHDAPIAYFRMNEASGTVLNDASNSALNGTLTASGITYSQAGAILGEPNTALLFDAATGHGLMNASTLTDGLGTFSIEFWMNLTSNGYAGSPVMVANDNPAVSNNGFRFNLTTNGTRSLVFIIGNGAGAHGTGNVGNTLNAGNWNYIVGTFDGTLGSLNGKIYINGPRVKTLGLTGTVGTAAQPISIAWDSVGSLFGGLLDEMALYNYVLTPNQITNHFNAGIDSLISKPSHKAFARVA